MTTRHALATVAVLLWSGSATAQDLVIDTTARVLRLHYLASGASPHLQIRVFREVDGAETLVEERTVAATRGQRVNVIVPVSMLTNCLYKVEVTEGRNRSTEVLNLYQPSTRSPVKQRQVSSLLAVPLALVGGFLERYTSVLMTPQAMGIWTIDVDSGQIAPFARSLDGKIADLAVASADVVAYTAMTAASPSGEVFIVRRGESPRHVAVGASPVWSDTHGRLFFVRDGTVFTVALDSKEPDAVTSGTEPAFVQLLGFPAGGGGRLLAASKLGSDSVAFWLVDTKTGAAEPVSYDAAYLWLPALSPDRAAVAFSEYVGAGARSRLMVKPLNAAPCSLTDGTWDDSAPRWSPDGKSVYFVSDRPE